MKLFLIALGLTLVVLLVGAGLIYYRPVNWSMASIAQAKPETEKVNANNGKRSPVIVELFTSEGCSSCPPADKILEQLQTSQPVEGAEIIALSEHVDYWNYIGWSDPFSSELFSARQQAYAPVFRNDGVYTPQMVVDGQAEFVGSNLTKAQTAIARAAKFPKGEVNIQLSREAQALKLKINVANLPAITVGDTAELLLAITENNLASQVARGENSGRRLPHTAVARELRSLGRIDDPKKLFEATATAALNRQWKQADLRIVAFVQERANKRILAAGSTTVTTK